MTCARCVPGQRCHEHRPGPQHLDSHRWARLAVGRASAKLQCLECGDVLMWDPREFAEPNASKLGPCRKRKPPTAAPSLTNGESRAREAAVERARAARDDRRKA